MDCSHDRRYFALVLLAIFASLRLGEATALRQADLGAAQAGVSPWLRSVKSLVQGFTVQPAPYDAYAGDRDQGSREAALMDVDDVAHLAEALAGVRRTAREGLAEWRYHGRLVARQLDDVHLVIRADFDFRDSILRQFPGTFSVPTRYIKHMMVVADLAGGDAGAIEDALEAAWQLQRSAD